MGNTTSMDFRANVVQMHKKQIDLADHNFWRTIFITAMDPGEIAAFLSWDEVRRLRRLQPKNLACLIYKAMEQLESFCASPSMFIDHTAVLNSIRILGQLMPVLFEPLVVPEKEPPLSVADRKNPPPPPPPGGKTAFSDDFVHHVFWENKMCDGEETFLTNGGVPLGERLVQLLVKSCFIPGFSVGKKQTSTLATQNNTNKNAEGWTADDGLVWFRNQTTDASVTVDVMRNRVDLMRALLAMLSAPVFNKDPLLENPFLKVIRDAALSPFSATLCSSLVGVIVHHTNRGKLPFTSYWGADLPENVLALSMQLLSVVLCPAKGALLERRIAQQREQEEKQAKRERGEIEEENEEEEVGKNKEQDFAPVLPAMNAWWHIVDAELRNTKQLDDLMNGLQRVIDNPFYTTQTVISGSQRTVLCHVEAMILLLTLVEQHHMMQEALAERMDAFFFPFLYFVQESKVDNLLFGEVQIVSYILMIMSTNQTFLHLLSKPLPKGKCPLSRIPAPPSATYGDVLVLATCMVISISTPRWLLPLFPIFSTMFSNITGHTTTLAELTCFEVHHMLEMTLSKRFLRLGEVNQIVAALLVEGANKLMQFNTRGVLPLMASLAVSDLAPSLQDLVSKTNEELEDEDDDNVKASRKRLLKLGDSFRGMIQSDLFLYFSTNAKDKLGEVEKDAAVQEASRKGDKEAMYKALGHAVTATIMPPSEPLQERMFTVTDEVKSWVTSYLWGIVHHHNTKPSPLFDASAAVAFVVK